MPSDRAERRRLLRSGGSGVGTDLSRLGTPQRGIVVSTRQASGGLDRATLQSDAPWSRHDLERCLEGEKKRRALDVDLRVAASGRVRRAQVRGEKKRLGSCVTEVLRATRFDARPKATRAKLRLEFAPPR